MKIWKIIKEINKNTEKVFCVTTRPSLKVYFDKTYERILLKENILVEEFKLNERTLERSWKEVKQPVDFITAVNSGKRIKWSGWDYGFQTVREALKLLTSHNDDTIRNYINDNWYIED